MTEKQLAELEKKQMDEWDEHEHSASRKLFETYRCPKCRTESALYVKNLARQCLNPSCNNTKALSEKVAVSHPRKH